MSKENFFHINFYSAFKEVFKQNRTSLLLIFCFTLVWIVFFTWVAFTKLSSNEERIDLLLNTSFVPFLAISFYSIRAWNYFSAKRKKFWTDFALLNGWLYSRSHDISKERWLIGSDRRYSEHMLKRDLDGYPTRIFNYTFVTGGGKNSTSHYLTVFGFTFPGSFPHLYLDRGGTTVDVWGEKIISLPSEFEEKFKLFAPREYEIEALQIFTPDILWHLLEVDFKYDIEFVDREVLIFVDGHIDNLERFEKEFEAAKKIRDLLAPTLNSIKFSPIGDQPYYLSR